MQDQTSKLPKGKLLTEYVLSNRIFQIYSCTEEDAVEAVSKVQKKYGDLYHLDYGEQVSSALQSIKEGIAVRLYCPTLPVFGYIFLTLIPDRPKECLVTTLYINSRNALMLLGMYLREHTGLEKINVFPHMVDNGLLPFKKLAAKSFRKQYGMFGYISYPLYGSDSEEQFRKYAEGSLAEQRST